MSICVVAKPTNGVFSTFHTDVSIICTLGHYFYEDVFLFFGIFPVVLHVGVKVKQT